MRKRVERVRALGWALAGDAYLEAADGAAISEAVGAALADGPDALCLVGGDGTVQAALTALDRRAPDGGWPLLAPVAAGSDNVTARDVGAGGDPLERLTALRRWRDGELDGRRLRRAVLRVEHPDAGRLCGMFFGTAMAAAGVAYFRERLDGVGVRGQVTSALALARMLWGLAFGDGAEGVEPRRVEVAADGGPGRERSCLLCMAATLETYLLGTRPYWGDGGAPIHYTLVEREPRRLWRTLPRLARGRPGGALGPEGGYHSRDVRRLELRFDGPVVVDGELFRVRAEAGPVRIGVAAEPEWLVV